MDTAIRFVYYCSWFGMVAALGTLTTVAVVYVFHRVCGL